MSPKRERRHSDDDAQAWDELRASGRRKSARKGKRRRDHAEDWLDRKKRRARKSLAASDAEYEGADEFDEEVDVDLFSMAGGEDDDDLEYVDDWE